MEESVQRKFIIGDEWLYFKIYSGPKTLESILLNEVYILVNELMAAMANLAGWARQTRFPGNWRRR